MWFAGTDEPENEMEDISRCFIFFPQFMEDFHALLENKVITRKERDRYLWNCSLASLGEYFYNLLRLALVPGGFWNPVETAFGIERGKLRRLVSSNGREFKRDKSKDYEKILAILQPYREQIKLAKQDIEKLKTIERIIEETDQEDSDEVRENLEKIKNILG
jgi:hypothetical protein